MTFDNKPGTLLIFGSDSHGEDWDNSDHEFSPIVLKWIDHYLAYSGESYRADERGIAVTGKMIFFDGQSTVTIMSLVFRSWIP